MKTIGIVFLYYPNESEIVHNIGLYADSLIKLLIYNNTPNVTNDYYEKLCKGCIYYDKIEFWGGEGNKGLALPINLAMQKAIIEEYDALLTMDQDSIWVNFNEFIENVEKELRYRENIYRPNIYNAHGDSLFFITNNVLFNSGTLYGANALKRIGLMNETMFVEGIDIEYGIRAKLANVSILTYKNGKMEHNKEEVCSYHKRILGRNIPRCKYNSQRLYGITFSNVLMAREFSGEIRRNIIKGIFVSYGFKTTILPILLFEKNKFSRIYNYFKGIWNGLFVEVTKRY
ncbi:MAG: hypothetical protein Q4E60_08805 [Bacteroidales bacterium]|nr:hypothetical protein [Bacteroidales bacterium]